MSQNSTGFRPVKNNCSKYKTLNTIEITEEQIKTEIHITATDVAEGLISTTVN